MAKGMLLQIPDEIHAGLVREQDGESLQNTVLRLLAEVLERARRIEARKRMRGQK